MVNTSSQHRHESTPTTPASGRLIEFQAVVYGSLEVPDGMSTNETESYVRENSLTEGFWNKTTVLVGSEPDEMIDALTNEIMDYVRQVERLDPDSDEHDAVRTHWQNRIRGTIQPR